MRQKNLMLNTSLSLLLKIITMMCGFIVPQLMLKTFGSATNGLVNSIAQFLTIISFMEFGVGTVVESALYKPLAKKNEEEISRIITSAQKFFKKLALIFLVYVIILVAVYPTVINRQFDTLFTATLVIAVSINSFARNYFGVVDNLLLNADQHGYIAYILQILTILINTCISVVLIKLVQPISVIKISTALVYLLMALFQRIYVNLHYKIDRKIKYREEPIKQKWNGTAQHIAAVVIDSTDNIILTLFSTLQNVSIYSVYYLVVLGIKQLTISLTNGIKALLGELWAKRELDELAVTFAWVEWGIHTFVLFIFGCTTMLISPFIQVYTNGVTDAEYVQPLFGVLLTLANAAHCLRYPYSLMILAAGHYRQTQRSYIVATIMNISISIIAVKGLGLIGVAIGTVAAMFYQTGWMAIYESKHLLKWPIRNFIKQVLVDSGTFIVAAFLSSHFKMTAISYFAWISLAIKVAVVWICVILAVNCIFYQDKIKKLFSKLKKNKEIIS